MFYNGVRQSELLVKSTKVLLKHRCCLYETVSSSVYGGGSSDAFGLIGFSGHWAIVEYVVADRCLYR